MFQMRKIFSIFITISAFLLRPAPSIAQTPDTATIVGQVVNSTHAVVTAVRVTATNNVTGLRRSVETNSLGKFSLGALPVTGSYTITAGKTGFADARVENLTLGGGRTAEMNLQLSASAGSTVIEVTGIVGDVLTDEPQLGERVDAKQTRETPLLNRRITYLPLLNAANRPALNQGDVFMNQNLFTTNGSGRRQTSFEVDGSSGNDSWGRQTVFTNLPLASVQEMTVLENAFSAEYGATTGGVVNIVTKTGSSDFHGEALELFRPSDTQAKLSGFTPANAPNGNAITDDSLMQTSASLGGPIGSSGRTHFFISRRSHRGHSRGITADGSHSRVSITRLMSATASSSAAALTVFMTRTRMVRLEAIVCRRSIAFLSDELIPKN